MNEHLENWIWNYSKVPSKHLLVALALAKHANGSGEATVKVSSLATMCRCSEADIKVSLRYIRDQGEIEIIQNTDAKGQRATNTYWFKAYSGPKSTNGDEGDIDFEDIPLPGIPAPPKVKDLPQEPQQKLMMDEATLQAIAADPIYRGLDVMKEAWRFKRWAAAHNADTTVRRFKVWLSRV